MKKILYLVLVAVLAAAVPAWGQTNRTLGDIPTGWKVQAGSVNFTADENNHEVQIPADSTVTLTPMYPAKVKSVKLKDVPPTGAIKGEFTVNAGGKKVWFSQGNLQAVCSSADNDASTQETWTWRFAANQWEYIGSAAANNSINGNGSVSPAGTVDLFGWVGTSSSYDNYGIWNNTTANSYGNTKNESLKHDWGHNAIANGGNSADMWRTLTREEWGYMLSTRSGATVNETNEVRFAKATIRTDETAVKGLLLFPDGATFDAREASWGVLNDGYNNYTTTCTAAQWTALEAKGCVFLPAAGNRTGATVSNESSTGAYWTATGSNQSGYYTWAHMVYFNPNTWSTSSSYKEKSYGLSVRLVKVVPHAVDLSTLTGDYEAQDGDILINTLAGNYKITIADRATVTLRNATINGTNNNSYQWAGITCLGDATIVLEGTNTVTGFHHYYPGIQVAHNGTGSGDEYTLTIKGDGSLTASSNYSGDFCAAGIGAGYNHACGNILIESGTIVAESVYHGAGIGGATYASCGTITITGGTVTATGGQYGAGIGSGSATTSNPSEFCAAITITGGTVTAIGGEHGAGIGSGYKGKCQSISITGGTVIATGYGGGAGVGSGKDGSCSTITIADGVTQVTATKGANAPYSIGAGGGSSASCGTVTIGGTEYYNGTNYENEGATYLAQSPLGYPAKVAAAATAGDLGKVIGANGCIYDDAAAATAAGTTALALICYVGSDASNAPYNHGLALALTDANDGNYAMWCSHLSEQSEICLTTQYNNETAAKTDMAGIGNTLYLNYHAPTGHTHTAASAVINYNGGTHPTGTSAWFLPSAGQWEKMINACKNVLGTNNNYTDLRDGFSTRGGTNLKSNNYWSSTEGSAGFAWEFYFLYGHWTGPNKGSAYVRACLAF